MYLKKPAYFLALFASREIQSRRVALSLFVLIFLQIMFEIITHYLSLTHSHININANKENGKSKYVEAYL